MTTYLIHFNGLVQGVGFRPLVCRLAKKYNITGTVCNANTGVHIECTAATQLVQAFYKSIIESPPPNAIITGHSIRVIESKTFLSFTIIENNPGNNPDLLLTPDICICKHCSSELSDSNNKRYGYPFITCLDCGPRFSIMKSLPYDRDNTTMHKLMMCNSCKEEYANIDNSRHYSQTNSCKSCTIPIHLYKTKNEVLSSNADEIITLVITALQQGKTVAVKGIGGYLLLCDASNEIAIKALRQRKKRPAKPFALLYTDESMAAEDVCISADEMKVLKDKPAPIVLLKLKPVTGIKICTDIIAPGLDKIGVMMPYTGLLLLISKKSGTPLVATSANISGSPVIYKDDDALEILFDVADLVLTFERDIVVPQDDSVLQITDGGQKIILRRSRGLAPNYFPMPFSLSGQSILAMGADMKSAFAISNQEHLYISQFLGNQETLESQTAYKETLQHFTSLLKILPQQIIIDTHPNYAVSAYGKKLAQTLQVPLFTVQHHKAHFGSVLAENNLLKSKDRVLGFIWDGTGYGDDAQVWGGEVFLFQHNEMDRIAWLDYFPQLLGDKMSKEPRLSVLSLLKNFPDKQLLIQKYFTDKEWKYYQSLIQQPPNLLTSSMGRFLDGIALLLDLTPVNAYEGQAVMQLEVLARKCLHPVKDFYSFNLLNHNIQWNGFLGELITDMENQVEPSVIAVKIFNSLVGLIKQISEQYQISCLAFSGGVFQNAFLTDCIVSDLSATKRLYFHQQLSPNDEGIALGQLACFYLKQQKEIKSVPVHEDELMEL